MARYAISPEGANALNALANNLLINANNIVEASGVLKNEVSALSGSLGIFEDEILGVVSRNIAILQKNKDSILALANRVKLQADDIALMCSFDINKSKAGVSSGYSSSIANNTNTQANLQSEVVISGESVGADGEKHDYRTVITYSDKPYDAPVPVCFGCESAQIQAWGKRHYSKWVSSLSSREKRAILNYTGESSDSYRLINTSLRAGFPLNEHENEMVSNIHNALSRATLPHDMQVFRALDDNGIRELALYCNQGNIEVGASLQDSAFMSCSLLANNSFNTDRSNKYILRLSAPEGLHAAYVYKVSSFSTEQEMLVDKDHSIFITGVSKCPRKDITQNSWDNDMITIIDGILSI